MNTDIPLPPHVPVKRKQLRDVLDVHIAMWLAGDTITDYDRARLEGEKAERARRRRRPPCVVGVLVGPEGLTPAQLRAVRDALAMLEPTEIHLPFRASRQLQAMCRERQVPLSSHRDLRQIVRNSQHVVAAPRERVEPKTKTGVWDSVKFAKHRSLAVTVILPDGTNVGRGGGS